MQYKLKIALLLFIPIYAHADWFHSFASYDCLSEEDLFRINYEGAYNEKGEALKSGVGKIDPWTLIEVDESGNHISKMKTIKGECQLSDGSYTIEIGPAPGNMNIQGRCGSAMSVWAAIYKGETLLFKTTFQSDCHVMNGDVLTEIIWRSGADSPELNSVSYNNFYQ